jgi:formyl-CoA transferase
MNEANKSPGALNNITVLDLSRVLCGPYCTMIFADMGANVIKIENPSGGDDTRAFGPFRNNSSVYFANLNRNKKSVTLNLKDPEAKEIFKEMVKEADVVIENYRPGVMDKLGLGYGVLKELNEQIVFASASGFGQYGPYAQRPGYDILAQAMGGMMSINGQPGDPPTRVGAAMGDILGGMTIAIGVLAALNARAVIGRGQQVDVALTDTVSFGIFAEIMRYLESGVVPERIGNRYAALAPYDAFKAKDGEFIIACGNQKLYETLCEKVLRRPELITDERFDTTPKRAKNHAALKPCVEAWTQTVTVAEGVAAVMAAGIPAGPINDARTLTQDEHIAKAREMYLAHEHPEIGKMTIIGNPIKLMETKPGIRTPAPLLGQHNEEVYGQFLGFSREKINDLHTRGVI